MGVLLLKSGENRKTGAAEHRRHLHEGKADERRRVVRGDAFHERDPELFDLGRTRAVKGLFAVDVGFDRLARKRTHLHDGERLFLLGRAVGGEDAKRRVEGDGLALHGFELRDRV